MYIYIYISIYKKCIWLRKQQAQTRTPCHVTRQDGMCRPGRPSRYMVVTYPATLGTRAKSHLATWVPGLPGTYVARYLNNYLVMCT